MQYGQLKSDINCSSSSSSGRSIKIYCMLWGGSIIDDDDKSYTRAEEHCIDPQAAFWENRIRKKLSYDVLFCQKWTQLVKPAARWSNCHPRRTPSQRLHRQVRRRRRVSRGWRRLSAGISPGSGTTATEGPRAPPPPPLPPPSSRPRLRRPRLVIRDDVSLLARCMICGPLAAISKLHCMPVFWSVYMAHLASELWRLTSRPQNGTQNYTENVIFHKIW